jgi:hypothetical protein
MTFTKKTMILTGSGVAVAALGISLGLVLTGGSTPGGCPQVAAWYKTSARPTLGTLNNDIRTLTAAFDSDPLGGTSLQQAGSQLSQDALNAPANFPWAATGHGSGPAADAGKQWAFLLQYSALLGQAEQNGISISPIQMGNLAAKASSNFGADMKECGIS